MKRTCQTGSLCRAWNSLHSYLASFLQPIRMSQTLTLPSQKPAAKRQGYFELKSMAMQPDSVSIFTSKNDGFLSENKIMYPLDFLKKSSDLVLISQIRLFYLKLAFCLFYLHEPVETANRSEYLGFQHKHVTHIFLLYLLENFHNGKSVPSFLKLSDSSS